MTRPDAQFRTIASVAVVSALQVAFEVLIIKFSRYEVGSLAIGTIGLAVLGVSLAAPLARALGSGERSATRSLAILLPTSIGVGAWFLSRTHDFHDEASSLVAMAASGLAALILLALASVPVFVALTRDAGTIPRLYGASLAGATFGAPLVLAAMELGGDIGAFAGTAASVGVAGALVARSRRGRIAFLTASTGALALVLVLFPQLDRAAHADAIVIRTNAASRIDVYRKSGGGIRIRTAGVNAGTSSPGGTVAAPPSGLDRELAAAPFRLAPRRVLILGSGAGKNVIQALARGSAEVVAVEINPMIPEAMRSTLRAESDPYRDPRVELLIDEGRQRAAELAASGRRFDLIYVPIATLFGSSGHTFTETYLMTREAFAGYTRGLAPRGVVATYFPSVARAKVTSALARALADRGVRDARSHVVVLERDDAFVALARVDAPFDDDERRRLRQPGAVSIDVPAEVAAGRALRPLEDDDPFLYNDIASAGGTRALYGWNRRFLEQAFGVALAASLAIAMFAVARRRGPDGAARAQTLAVFALLGVGYTAHQTLVLQRLGFLVGHPVLATAIVLPATLAASALGATLAGRVPAGRLLTFRVGALALLVAATIPLIIVSPSAWIAPTWSIGARSACAGAIAAVIFLPLGTFFPLALARDVNRGDGLSDLAWLANGVGAVVGSIGAILGPMLHGFASTASVTIAAYVVVSVWDAADTVAPGRRTERWVVVTTAALFAFAGAALLLPPDGPPR